MSPHSRRRVSRDGAALDLVPPSPPARDHRNEIQRSWHRSRLAGLTHESPITVATADYDKASRLLAACGPVIERIEEQIRGHMVGGLIADRNGVVVRRFFGLPSFDKIADDAGCRSGAVLDEVHSGTNAIATPLETRQPLFVRPAEHYLASLQQFVCYGVPVLDPITRRLEGVIDLMAPASTDAGLMKAVLDQAVLDTRTRLSQGNDERLLRSVALFGQASSGLDSSTGLMMMGDDLLLQNARCAELIDQADYALFAEFRGRYLASPTEVALSSGAIVSVRSRVADSRTTLLEIRDAESTHRRVPRGANATIGSEGALQERIRAAAAGHGHVFVTGERGCGTTTTALEVATLIGNGISPRRIELSCGTLDSSLEPLFATAGPPLVLDGIDVIDSRSLLRLLSGLLAGSSHQRVVLVGAATDRAGADVLAVTSRCLHHIEVPPLRERTDHFREISTTMLRVLGDPTSRLTLPAQDALKAQLWPGNLVELRLVLQDALNRRSTGDISLQDLPLRYQEPPMRRKLSMLEQAERSAILSAMRQTRNNKVQAALRLGLSRSTLYQRLRYFDIN